MKQGRYFHLAAMAGALVLTGWLGPRAHAAEIPGFPDWQSETFGDTEQGSATIDANGVLTIRGAGQDTWDRSDEFHIVYKPLTGDGAVTTRLLSTELSDHSEWSKFGIMVRNDLENPAAAVLQLHMTTGHAGDYLVRGISDPDDGFSSEQSSRIGKDDKLGIDGANYFPREFPVWLKIERRGDRFTGYVSTDGQMWTPVTRALQIVMKEEVVAGMYVLGILETMLSATYDGNASSVSNTLLKPEEAYPLQPDEVNATGGNNSVLLTWTPVDHLGHPADGYIVYKAKPGETEFTKVTELAGDKTSYLDEAIQNGETARYRVTTVVRIADKTLESRTVNGKMIEVTGAPDPPLRIGDRDFASSILDGGGGLPYNETPGSATADADGVVTLSASGWGIGERFDGGQALLTPVNGDFTFTARLLDLPSSADGDVSPSAKFGIAVRENTLAESRNAGILVSSDGVIHSPHQRLLTTMWSDDRIPGDSTTDPIFLRIQRRGDEIKLFTSPDGTTFTEFGDPATTTLTNLPASVFVGLVGTAGNNDQVAEARFDQITISTP